MRLQNVVTLLLAGVTMIGAMPAVAVRHERRKQEKRNKRPSQLYLAGYGLRHPSPPSRGSSPTPSPLQSPPNQNDDVLQEFYICGKVMTHFIFQIAPLIQTGTLAEVWHIHLSKFRMSMEFMQAHERQLEEWVESIAHSSSSITQYSHSQDLDTPC
jgi:hypothetical protein